MVGIENARHFMPQAVEGFYKVVPFHTQAVGHRPYVLRVSVKGCVKASKRGRGIRRRFPPVTDGGVGVQTS